MMQRAFSWTIRMLSLSMALSACAEAGEPSEAAEGAPSDLPAGQDAPEPAAQHATARPRAPWWPSAPACQRAPSCKGIDNGFVTVGACCTKDIPCGLDLGPFKAVWPWLVLLGERDLVVPKDFNINQPCIEASRLFIESKGEPEERFTAEVGDDILVTPTCKSRHIFTFRLPGCCLPSGQCGLSTHVMGGDLKALVQEGKEEPRVLCGTADEISAQFGRTTMSALAKLPALSGTCDYAALDARLPPAKEDPWVGEEEELPETALRVRAALSPRP